MCKTLGSVLIGNDYGPCKFLKRLYCLDGCWYIMGFLWTHGCRGHHHDLKHGSCGFHIESVHHVLWICPIAREVWKRVLRILYLVYGKQMYTWGSVRRGRLAKEIQNYEKECWFSSSLWWKASIGCLLFYNNPLFGKGQGLVYDIFFSNLGIVEGKM